jgi:hypothetical protein
MVDHLCGEIPLKSFHGMGVAWSPRDYSNISLVHGMNSMEWYAPRRLISIGISPEKDRHETILRCLYEFLVIPLGLRNAPTTYQFFLQLHRFLFMFFGALSIYNKTWEDPLR